MDRPVLILTTSSQLSVCPVPRAGMLGQDAVPIPIKLQGGRFAAAISAAGPDITLGELQRIVRVLRPQIRQSPTFRFEPGSTRLDAPSQSNLMHQAQAIRDGRYAGQALMLVGFSDGRGPAWANRDQDSARAEAVRRDLLDVLSGHLPATVTLQTEAFGEALPMGCDDLIWGNRPTGGWNCGCRSERRNENFRRKFLVSAWSATIGPWL